MSESCERIRPRLPEWVRGGAGAGAGVGRHVAECSECAAEEAVLRALLEARPEPPEGLARRIQVALQARGAPSRPGAPSGGTPPPRGSRSWGPSPAMPAVAAAAVLVLALGTAVIWATVGGNGAPTLPDASLDRGYVLDPWAEDPSIVAGAPVIEELTDEQLLELLEALDG